MSTIPKAAYVEAQRYTAQIVIDGSPKILECIFVESHGLNIKSNGSVSPRNTPRTSFDLKKAINVTLQKISQGKRKNGELVQSHQDRSFQLYSAMCEACEKSLSPIKIPASVIDKISKAFARKDPGLQAMILDSGLFKNIPSQEKKE